MNIVDSIRDGVVAMTPAAKMLYAAAIRNVIAQGVFMLLSLGLGAAISTFLLKTGFHVMHGDKYNSEENSIPFFLFGGAIGITTLITWFTCGGEAIARLTAPELIALRDLIGILR